jgi:hypothetical protein
MLTCLASARPAHTAVNISLYLEVLMPRSLLVRLNRRGFCRWAAFPLILLASIATLDRADAAQMTFVQATKNAANPSDYSLTGPRREFRSEVVVKHTVADSFYVRYASVLAVDVAAGGNTESEGVTCSYRITFAVQAGPGEPWTIKLWSHRKGAYTIIDDNGGRGTAEINSSITATSSTGHSLAAHQFVGGSEHNHGNPSQNKIVGIDNPGGGTKAWALLSGTGPVATITLNFTWGENVISDPNGNPFGGDEAAVRMGLSTIGVNRVKAGDYEELNDRVKENDGHFVGAKMCAPPAPGLQAASFCSPLDNSSCTFTAAGQVIGCLGNCYTVVCSFYNSNGVLVKTASAVVTDGNRNWVALGTNSGPCNGAPYTVDVVIIDDACSVTSEDLLAAMAGELPAETASVLMSQACTGTGGGIGMPATSTWGQIAAGVALLLGGALAISRRRRASS